MSNQHLRSERWALFLWGISLFPVSLIGQPNAGHLRYGLITAFHKDSVPLSPREEEAISALFAPMYAYDVYYNKSSVAFIKQDDRGIHRTVFDRSSGVLHEFETALDGRPIVTRDSVMHKLSIRPTLQRIADTLATELGLTSKPGNRKTRHGLTGRLLLVPSEYSIGNADSIWVADFGDVPGIIYPVYYFLVKGIPVCFTIHMEGWLVTFGIVSFSRKRPDKSIFSLDETGYTFSSREMAEEIPEFLHFIRTYDPGKK